eukprot:TRINITY_DN15265_c0_g1_i1.p1 TRINITY_DN15265_c0_g1~~TRINITY_DN15265_c0_g1_i1.p1  ORF type:complete len:285 (-),score=47.47 TRINITY_DN15265_c0_g1_i1:123-977(-)
MPRGKFIDRIREQKQESKFHEEGEDVKLRPDECISTPSADTNDLESLLMSKLTLTSDDLWKRAEERKMMKWNEFVCGEDSTFEQLEKWLDENRPSVIDIKDGTSWLYVKHPMETRGKYDAELRKEALEAWAKSKEKTNEKVIEFAHRFGVKGGKWLIMAPSEDIDAIWFKIATAILRKELGENVLSAKVSTNEENGDKHVICIYTNNFLEQKQSEVLRCEFLIRKLGIKCRMSYKPDICSILGIYRCHTLKPSILVSNYSPREQAGSIEVEDEVYEALQFYSSL